MVAPCKNERWFFDKSLAFATKEVGMQGLAHITLLDESKCEFKDDPIVKKLSDEQKKQIIELTGVKENETYSVLLKDPKDSTYDIWYKVALFDGYAYAKFDYEKMDDEYVSTFNEMAFTEDYCKCDNMSDEMFKGFLEN